MKLLLCSLTVLINSDDGTVPLFFDFFVSKLLLAPNFPSLPLLHFVY